MEAHQIAIPEYAANGWPFPGKADSITRTLIESYAPINAEFEREIAEAKAKMALTLEEKERALKVLSAANVKHDLSAGEYRQVIRRLNEWRENEKAKS